MIAIATLKFILAGSFLGLTAGVSPGPVLALVISQSLRYGRKEGMKIAFAPLIADVPIVFITVLVLSKISQFDLALGIISLAGGIFAAFLGYESIRSKGLVISEQVSEAKSLKRGIIAGSLNPHPYLFWATIGAPYLLKAYETSIPAAILFVISFYVFLVGSKITIAILASRSKKLLEPKSYLLTIRILGVALFAFSIFFFYDGIKYLSNSF